MNVLIVQFRLNGIDHETYLGFTREVAPAIAEVPGLISKAWLSDQENNQYGGVYLFEHRDSIEGYLGSPMIRSFFETGPCSDVRIEVFDTIEPATSMTSRQLATVAA